VAEKAILWQHSWPLVATLKPHKDNNKKIIEVMR